MVDTMTPAPRTLLLRAMFDAAVDAAPPARVVPALGRVGGDQRMSSQGSACNNNGTSMYKTH